MAKSFSSYSGSTTPPTSLFRLLPAEISITFGLMKSRSWIHTTGKHVPSLAEEKRKRDGNLHEIWGCTRNIIFSVPPHVCLHDTFSKPEYDLGVSTLGRRSSDRDEGAADLLRCGRTS